VVAHKIKGSETLRQFVLYLGVLQDNFPSLLSKVVIHIDVILLNTNFSI